jgi:uncharacterized protein
MSKELKKQLKIIKDDIGNLEKTYGVKKMGVFGSFVNGKPNKKSDIDILVEFKSPVGFFKFIELEDALSKKLKREVDLVTVNALKPAIKRQVLSSVVYV